MSEPEEQKAAEGVAEETKPQRRHVRLPYPGGVEVEILETTPLPNGGTLNRVRLKGPETMIVSRLPEKK